MPRSRCLAGLVLAALVLAGLTACGGGDDGSAGTDTEAVPADQWADEVCNVLQTLAEAVQTNADQLAQVIPTLGQTPTPKEAVEGPVADMSAAYTDAQNGVEDAGVPDVPGGGDVSQALQDTIEQVNGQFDEAYAAVDAASPTDAASVTDAAQALAQALTTATTTLIGTPDLLAGVSADASDELTAAFEQSAACQQLAAAAG